ncbi:ATP-binding protein [Xanthomonas protegens]|uniref:histidine kinase n=1 Tax=Xanthomonas protegens TaxID=3380705 RepID=A0ABU9LGM1_9XANT
MKTFTQWLKAAPIQDPIERKNAPLVQLFFLFSFAYLFVTKGVFTFYEVRLANAVPPTLALDAVVDGVIALSALAGFILVRRGLYRLALRTFVGVLLALVLYNYATVGAQHLFPTPLPLLILSFGGLLIGRRDMWWIYAVLLASLGLGIASDYFHFSSADGLSSMAMERMASIGGLYTMSAIIFDGAIRALREGIKDARTHAQETARANQALAAEMEKRRETQRRLLHTQKLDAINRTAAGVAHDFDNLLSVILGYAMQRGRMAEHGAEELQKGLASIERVARQALDLTDRLLSFSRLEDIKPVRFELDRAVAELVPMLRQLFDPSIRIDTIAGTGARMIEMDRHQFDVMVLNIASNACDAMQELSNGTFTITTRVGTDDEVELELHDSGVGIGPEVLPRIFDAFFTTKPSGHGTGLGLAGVLDIVSAIGGRVRVDSEPGAGTAVTLSLPCVQ